MAVVVVVLLVCAVESVLKGWFSLLMLPASVVILPLEFFLQRLALRTQHRLDSRYLFVLRGAQLLALLLSYVAIVGFGDTDDVLLFGFKLDKLDSALTNFSWALFSAASIALVALTVWLLVAVVRRRSERLPNSHPA